MEECGRRSNAAPACASNNGGRRTEEDEEAEEEEESTAAGGGGRRHGGRSDFIAGDQGTGGLRLRGRPRQRTSGSSRAECAPGQGGSLNTNKIPNVRIGGRVLPPVGEPTARIRPATGLGGDGRQRERHVALLPRFSFQ